MICRLFAKLAIAAAVSLSLLALTASAVLAQQTVTARAALHEGFGRIVFDWPSATDYQTKRDGNRLLVTFKEPFTVTFESVKRVLGGYLSDVRLAAGHLGPCTLGSAIRPPRERSRGAGAYLQPFGPAGR